MILVSSLFCIEVNCQYKHTCTNNVCYNALKKVPCTLFNDLMYTSICMIGELGLHLQDTIST